MSHELVPGSAAAFVAAAVLAIAIGSAAFTITSAKISMPLRRWVATKAVKTKSPRWKWLAELLACPFCVSHWLAFAAVGIYRPWLVEANISATLLPNWIGWVFNFLVTCTAMTVVAMVAVWVIKKALLMDAPPKNPEPAAPKRSTDFRHEWESKKVP